MQERVYTNAEICSMHPLATDIKEMLQRRIRVKRIRVYPNKDLGLYPGIKASFFGIPVTCETTRDFQTLYDRAIRRGKPFQPGYVIKVDWPE